MASGTALIRGSGTSGFDGFEEVVGSNGGDIMYGDGRGTKLVGGAGVNYLEGSGTDILVGGGDPSTGATAMTCCAAAGRRCPPGAQTPHPMCAS